jgi:glycosyltransferase involved in cell wall biosynthesis
LLIARGGIERHGIEVLTKAAATGLRVVERANSCEGVRGVLQSLDGIDDADIVHLPTPLDPESCRLLFRGSAAVLANSGREPFGLVGLETMAAGGVACTGSTGEDYVVPGQNALVLETADPWEFVTLFRELRVNPARDRAVRRAGRATAEQFSWSHIVQRLLLPRLHLVTEQLHFGNVSRA